MIVIPEMISNKITKGTGMKMIPMHHTPTVNREVDDACSSKATEEEESAKRDEMDINLIRQTAASIADALLKLGDSEKVTETTPCVNTGKNRKRVISIAADVDSDSTNSQSTGNTTDASSSQEHTNKRQRTTTPPSHVVCSTPTKPCLPECSRQEPHYMRTRMNVRNWNTREEEIDLSFSTNEFQIKPSEKGPGDLGCISQLFHRDFRPLSAAPRMPKTIVPEDRPQMPSRRSSFGLPVAQGPMYSTAITEHNNCLIMHSYTVLPRMSPSQTTLAQLANGMQ